MRTLLTTIAGLFIHLGCFASEGIYAVKNIPVSLIKNANVVLRSEEIRFEISSTRNAVKKTRYVITILNENGDNWAQFLEHYDKHIEIRSIEGILYDANGKVLKKIKKKDAEDLSGVSESNLMDDNRVKRHNFYYKVYPYTVEYNYEIAYKSTLFFPSWVPQGGERLSVEKSSMTIIAPSSYVVRFKTFNYTGQPLELVSKNEKQLSWSAQNLKPIIREIFFPMWHEIATMVIFAPSHFQVDEYKGNMMTWEEFGKFIYTLKEGKEKLPEQVKRAVHEIADPIADPAEKVKALYAYMQKNTRYISIQLGIGGWQPFDANFVATKGYGDCKALTNYMYSLLKEVGIPSYYALVRAGKYANYLTHDFPAQQFNHVILCVPLKKDSMWLECTSQVSQAGYLGDFTSDRYALLVNEAGGKLVKTPTYTLQNNLQKRIIKANLDLDGTLDIESESLFTGLQQDNLHGLIHALSKEKVKEYLHEDLPFPTFEIESFQYTPQRTTIPSITEKLIITVNNYASITGKRIFIAPNIMTRNTMRLQNDSLRKYDIKLNFPYQDIDSVEIKLPAGYQLESLPKPVVLENKFGKFSSGVILKDNILYYTRSIEFNGGQYPAKDYAELVSFYEKVYNADNSKLVLVKE